MRFSEWMEIREAKDACYRKVKARFNVFPSAYASGALVQCRKKGAKNWGVKSEGTFDKEKENGLHGWFSRNQGKGWVDCKASKKGSVVPCGRNKAGRGTDREYPACRPTLSACNSTGKKRKKDSTPVSWKKN